MDAADADRLAAQIAEQAMTVIPDAIEPAKVASLVADVDRLHEVLDVQARQTTASRATHTLRVYNLLQSTAPMAASAGTRQRSRWSEREKLDRECLISSLSSITILPGESPQPIHADDQLIPIPKPHPPTVAQHHVEALTDFTDATRRHPDHARHPPVDHQPQVRRRVRHHPGRDASRVRARLARETSGTAAGQTATDRAPGRRTAMNYCAGYIRQQENQQLGIRRRSPARFDPAAPGSWSATRSPYNGLIGHIDKRPALGAAHRGRRPRRYGLRTPG